MSGFRKARKGAAIPHAQVGQHGQMGVSSGCGSLDAVVGGGLPIGSVLLIGQWHLVVGPVFNQVIYLSTAAPMFSWIPDCFGY